MVAAVHSDVSSKQALPVCLDCENSNRLVSLWNVVNQFNAQHLMVAVNILGQIEGQLNQIVRLGGGNRKPEQSQFDGIVKQCNWLREKCEEAGFNDSVAKINLTMRHIQDPTKGDASSLAAEVRHVIESVWIEGGTRKFIQVLPPVVPYVDQEALFGHDVYDRFPSARSDIRDAGNCLAVDLGTASVFHLMRTAEYGLRALAQDRQISLPKNLPIDLATWEDLIKQLEDAEKAIQGYPKTAAREEQFEFYHGAMMELKRFKNKFRNRVMHTRDDYDPDEAHSAFRHVCDFMKILASKISETTTTPMIWT